MRTDRLISYLAAGLKLVRRRSLASDLALLGLAGAAEPAVVLGLGAMRPDMPVAMEQPSFSPNQASASLRTDEELSRLGWPVPV